MHCRLSVCLNGLLFERETSSDSVQRDHWDIVCVGNKAENNWTREIACQAQVIIHCSSHSQKHRGQTESCATPYKNVQGKTQLNTFCLGKCFILSVASRFLKYQTINTAITYQLNGEIV